MPQLYTVTPSSLGALRTVAERDELFVILDACDEPRVPGVVAAAGGRAVSLYSGASADDLAAVAPYLAQVDVAMLEWIAASLWSDAWGIFAIARCELSVLRTHFRHFLLVDAPGNEQWYFRFYDPRVLARFLPTCTADQIAAFFGPVSAYGWVDATDYSVALARPAWFGDPAPAPRIRYRKTSV